MTDKRELKKFEDGERPRCCCYDCEAPYHSWPDMTIPDEMWEKINPTHHKGAGLLCPSCIAKRLQEVHSGEVECVIHV